MQSPSSFPLLKIVLCLGLLCSGHSAIAATGAAPAHPFPQHVAYPAGCIRPNHHTQAELDADVRAFYEEWKSQYLVSAGTNAGGRTLYRVSFGGKKPERTVSEGQGYGMVIVALMAGSDPEAQTIFDGLHDFALANPSSIDSRLMGWEVPLKKGEPDSAFDGDADIAYALLLAHAQWGSKGRVDYADAARTRLAGILGSTIGPESRLPMLGDWTEANGEKENQYTPRSSDLMPGHFRAWARFTGDPVWNTVATNSTRIISTLQANFSPKTGLLPDFIVDAATTPKPAAGKFLEGSHDGEFYYNAGRDPWRIAVDALLNGNAASAEQARKMAAWAMAATEGDPQKLACGYQLDGASIKRKNGFTTFFAAPLGVAAMLDAKHQTWLNALYDSVCKTHEDYFEDSITLQCMLTMSGNYWDPTTIVKPDAAKGKKKRK